MTFPRAEARGRSQSGFTLIEVLVALAVLSIAFVGLLGLHNRNLTSVINDQDLARATLLAREFITEMELTEEGNPELGATSGQFADAPGFFWHREVTETELPELRRVEIRIIWDERIPDACHILYFARDHRESPDQP